MAKVGIYPVEFTASIRLSLVTKTEVTIDTFALGLRFDAGTTYTVELEEGFVKETGANKFDSPAVGNLSQFTTNSTGPQVQVDEPQDGSTNITNNTFIRYTYDRQLLAGNGNYYLYKETGSPDEEVAVFNASDSTGRSTISGNQITLDVTGLMRAGETYYVLIDEGAVEDKDGLAAFGFDNDQEHRWTTATTDFPDLSAVMTDAFAPSITANITVNPFTDMSINAILTINAGRLINAESIVMNSEFTTNLIGVTWVMYSSMNVQTTQTTQANYKADAVATIQNPNFQLDGFAGFTTITFAEQTKSSTSFLYNTSVIGRFDIFNNPIFDDLSTGSNGEWVEDENSLYGVKGYITPNRNHVIVPQTISAGTGGDLVGNSGYNEWAVLGVNSGSTDFEVKSTLWWPYTYNNGQQLYRHTNAVLSDSGDFMVVVRLDRQSGTTVLFTAIDKNSSTYSSNVGGSALDQNPTVANGGNWHWTDALGTQTISTSSLSASHPRCPAVTISGDGKWISYIDYDTLRIYRRDLDANGGTPSGTNFEFARWKDNHSVDDYYTIGLGSNYQAVEKIATNATGTHFLYKQHTSNLDRLYILTNTSSTYPDVNFNQSYLQLEGNVLDYVLKDNGTELVVSWFKGNYIPNHNKWAVSVFKYINNQWLEAQRIVRIEQTSLGHIYGFTASITNINLSDVAADDVVAGGQNQGNTSITIGYQ